MIPAQPGRLAPAKAGEEEQEEVVASDRVRQGQDARVELRQVLARDVALAPVNAEPLTLEPPHGVSGQGWIEVGGVVPDRPQRHHDGVGGGVAGVATGALDLGLNLPVPVLDDVRRNLSKRSMKPRPR